MSAREHPKPQHSSPKKTGVFLTGATGFLGRRLLADMIRQGESVTVLVRAPDHDAARKRISEALATIDPLLPPLLASSLTVCPGALDRPGLGLAERGREWIVETCGTFVHCGASVRFDLPLETARAVNVEGTRAMLELALMRARRHGLQRFDFVGTAYVAGDHNGIVFEEEFDGSVQHRNSYERSKFEAERLVHDAAGDLPVTVYRPSIVTPVVESDARSPIDWPVRIYASGLWRTCPGRPDTPLDLVTSSFVCDSIRALHQTPASIGRTFHLTAGVEGAITLDDTGAVLEQLIPGSKPLKFVDPGTWKRYIHPILRWVPGSTGKIVRTGELYLPYFLNNPRFDNSNTVELLAGTGIEIPHSRDVLEQLLANVLHRRLARETSTGDGRMDVLQN